MLNNSPPPGNGPDSIDIIDQFIRILNKAAAIEKEPVDIGDGILLHASEVHLIEFCARFPDESMTRLSGRLGITKGAVSQTAYRLEKKGYLIRTRQQGDKKTIYLRLTGKGEEAYEWHRAYHERVNSDLEEMLSSLEASDRANIMRVLDQIHDIFNRCGATREEISEKIAKYKRNMQA